MAAPKENKNAEKLKDWRDCSFSELMNNHLEIDHSTLNKKELTKVLENISYKDWDKKRMGDFIEIV